METNQVLESLKLEKHPLKTQIGKIEKGFDFLGYHFTPKKLTPSSKTLKQYSENITRLKEQNASHERIEQYKRRWRGWATGGLKEEVQDLPT